MYLLSIDVGIKNLAYCLFDISNKDTYSIVEWKVINLCGEPPLCQEILKKPNKKVKLQKSQNEQNNTDKKCNKKARYTKENNYFCKIHAKSKYFKIPTPDLDIKQLKNTSLMNLYKLCDNYDILYKKPITKTNILELIHTHIKNNYFDSIHEINSKDCDFIMLGRNMRTLLTPLVNKYKIDIVLIENQLSPLANRMKTLQGMISQFFIMFDVPEIHYISATNKLKPFIGNKKTTYNERKKLGIEFCKNMIENENQFKKWNTTIHTKSKADDFADSFLQGLYYLNLHNLINIQLNKYSIK